MGTNKKQWQKVLRFAEENEDLSFELNSGFKQGDDDLNPPSK